MAYPKLQRIEDISQTNVYYVPNLFSDFHEELDIDIFDILSSDYLPWTQGRVKSGMEHRLTCMFADIEGNYTYSGKTMYTTQWNRLLYSIKTRVEEVMCDSCSDWDPSWSFDTCLCNLYSKGDSIGLHSDDEQSLVSNSPIASVSFGRPMRFDFKEKEKPNNHVYSLYLESGSLIVMGKTCQSKLKHQIPKQLKTPQEYRNSDYEKRVNLTFRRTKRHQ